MSWLWVIDDHPERVEQALVLKQSARNFVKWLGEKCDLIHDDMTNGLGLTRPLKEKIYEYPYEYPNESLRTANIVKEEIQQ